MNEFGDDINDERNLNDNRYCIENGDCYGGSCYDYDYDYDYYYNEVVDCNVVGCNVVDCDKDGYNEIGNEDYDCNLVEVVDKHCSK